MNERAPRGRINTFTLSAMELPDGKFQGYFKHTIEGEPDENAWIHQAGKFDTEKEALADANTMAAKYIEDHEFGW
jgi:hypothetical protein